MPSPIVLAITGDPVPEVTTKRGGFDRILAEAIGDHPAGYRAVDVRELPLELEAAAIVISGSAANVPTREAWMLRTEEALRGYVARKVPVLGVCFGHQLLAQALGGEVEPNPLGREMSTVVVERVEDDPLLAGLDRRFYANACHSDTVARIPLGATVLAKNDADANQVLRFAERTYGVQFHPEFDGAIMRNYVISRREALAAEGQDPDALERRAADTPEARKIFDNFLRMLG